MHVRRSVLLLLPLLAAMSGCSSAGKALAGGEGDPSVFYSVPPVPSPPLVLGTRVIRCEDIETSPVGTLHAPERQDRYQAVNDTTTITISAGPSSNTRFVKGEWLDPRIDDEMLIRDRGGQRWVGSGGVGASAVNIAIETDAAGNPQFYIVSKVTTAVFNTTVAVKRTFGFNYITPAIGGAAGLYAADCIVDSGDFADGREMDPGDWSCVVANQIGVAQWEHDTFTQHYRIDPFIPALRGQFTAFNTTEVPQNVEFEDIIFIPLATPRPYFSGYRTEREHSQGNIVQQYAWANGIGATFNEHIHPINSSGTWRGDSAGVTGNYLNHPYFLRNNPSPDNNVSFTVNDDLLLVNLTTNTVTRPLQIYRLDKDFLHAVRKIDDYTYEAMTLERIVPVGSFTLTSTSCRMTVQTISRSISSGVDTILGSYIVNPLIRG